MEQTNLPARPEPNAEPLIDHEEFWERAKKELDPKRWAFLNAMIQTFGNISQSMKIINMNCRKNYNYWMRTDPLFKACVESQEFDEMMKDYAESMLLKNIELKKEASIIFFLKTKAKDRGYVERQELKQVDPTTNTPSWFNQTDIPKGYNPEDFEEAEVVTENP